MELRGLGPATRDLLGSVDIIFSVLLVHDLQSKHLVGWKKSWLSLWSSLSLSRPSREIRNGSIAVEDKQA